MAGVTIPELVAEVRLSLVSQFLHSAHRVSSVAVYGGGGIDKF